MFAVIASDKPSAANFRDSVERDCNGLLALSALVGVAGGLDDAGEGGELEQISQHLRRALRVLAFRDDREGEGVVGEEVDFGAGFCRDFHF